MTSQQNLVAHMQPLRPKGGSILRREYEFIYISNPDIPEKPRHFEKYEKLLCAQGGEVVEKQDWGVKKMSYPINKQFRGHYMYYELFAEPTQIAEVERLMRIDDQVIRYMSLHKGAEKDRQKRIDERNAMIAKSRARVIESTQDDVE
jgi:small subunit ribosomal protein S6